MKKDESTALPAMIVAKVNESGLALTKAQTIAASYAELLNEVTEIEAGIKLLVKGEPADVPKAKAYRLALSTACSKAEKQKKTDKELLLSEGRFIDALYNTVEGYARLTQADAKGIETHFEKLEADRIRKEEEDRIAAEEALAASRLSELAELHNVEAPANLGAMSEEVWGYYLIGARAKAEADKQAARLEAERLEAERLAEIARLEQERAEAARVAAELEATRKELEANRQAEAARKAEADKAEAERLEAARKAEHERVAAEAKARARMLELLPLMAYICDYNALYAANDADYLKELERIKGLKADFEQQEADAKAIADANAKAVADKLKEIEQAIEYAEEVARKADILANAEAALAKAIQKAEADRLAELAMAPVKQQLSAWIASFTLPAAPEVAPDTCAIILARFEGFTKWAANQADQL